MLALIVVSLVMRNQSYLNEIAMNQKRELEARSDFLPTPLSKVKDEDDPYYLPTTQDGKPVLPCKYTFVLPDTQKHLYCKKKLQHLDSWNARPIFFSYSTRKVSHHNKNFLLHNYFRELIIYLVTTLYHILVNFLMVFQFIFYQPI